MVSIAYSNLLLKACICNDLQLLTIANIYNSLYLQCRTIVYIFRMFPGEVLTFGSNQFGQLGAGDVTLHHRIIRVRVPKASAVAAGSNHTAVMTRDGEVYTFGNYQVFIGRSLLRPFFLLFAFRFLLPSP